MRHRIVTPEHVAFHYTVAGLPSRCVAWVIDQSFIWAGYVAVVLAFARLGGTAGVALIILGVFAVDFGYFTLFELNWSGQSPGKRLMRIRVINARGGRLAAADVLARCAMRAVDVLPFAMVVGGTTALVDRLHRRLGDVVADTVVVRDERRALPATLAAAKGRVNSFAADPLIRGRILTRVRREERDLVLDLVLRRDQIEPAVREELFEKAAAHFRQRLDLPAEHGHLSDEQAVVNLALVIQDAKFAV